MLRSACLVLTLALLCACGRAADDPIGMAVINEDGVVLGQVASVERDGAGRIIAAEIPGLEPADAPEGEMVAEEAGAWGRTEALARDGAASVSRLR